MVKEYPTENNTWTIMKHLIKNNWRRKKACFVISEPAAQLKEMLAYIIKKELEN